MQKPVENNPTYTFGPNNDLFVNVVFEYRKKSYRVRFDLNYNDNWKLIGEIYCYKYDSERIYQWEHKTIFKIIEEEFIPNAIAWGKLHFEESFVVKAEYINLQIRNIEKDIEKEYLEISRLKNKLGDLRSLLHNMKSGTFVP